MSPTLNPDVIEREITDQHTDWLLPRRVVLHNCECHTFDQVILALVKTLPISVDVAREYANVVDKTGSAVVFEGDLEKCELVASNIVQWAGPGSTGQPLQVTVEE